MRIRNLCGDSETTYVYDTNAKLSRLLVKTTDGRVTKYVYGRGLIGEETSGVYKTYYFDYRGSTVAITDINGNVTDRFEYDTYGNTIGYRYDSIGNLSAIVYPDGTEVTYEYDVNNNLISVTDWEDRKTVYTYDENNKVIGVIKPDGSVTTTVYDDAGRVTSSVERNHGGVIITGFEYTYGILGRVSAEKRLEICYILHIQLSNP